MGGRRAADVTGTDKKYAQHQARIAALSLLRKPEAANFFLRDITLIIDRRPSLTGQSVVKLTKKQKRYPQGNKG
jgi:chorismate-pyruvate lyase